MNNSKDDGRPPSDHVFWCAYFSKENVSCHIYQDMVDVAAQYNINTQDLKDAISPIEPWIQTPSKIDHEAMSPFLPGCHLNLSVRHLRILPSSYVAWHLCTYVNGIILPIQPWACSAVVSQMLPTLLFGYSCHWWWRTYYLIICWLLYKACFCLSNERYW